MPYYDAKLALEVLTKKNIEDSNPEGTTYPALIEKGEIVFSHLPKDAHTVIVWQLGEKDTLGVRDRVVVSVYEKTTDGRWVMIY